jgi:D-alanyl-lipoteichoic acid acyltransferase DltB (MBOAT superfamily)
VLFHSGDFAAFFAVVILIYGLLGGRPLAAGLTAASYFFYGYIQPYYVLLLFLLTLSDYAIGLAAHRFRARWHGVLLSVVVNFGTLAYFKYANFGLETARAALDLSGLHVDMPRVTVLLPIGISFHVFQSFAYVMDVLHGRIAPCRSFLQYALYVSWFPQLVAGPIERPGRLMPQLAAVEERKAGFAERLPHAAALFAEGWIRKLAADVLSPTADVFFDAPAAATSSEAVFGIFAFGLQIYGDFSGYSRMAQGVSHAFGVDLMENFDRPYLARSFREFWRRWHISLSTWFRDYVYFPLGGNHQGPARARANILATMLLSGLWHGAGWTFLLWGAVHGAFMLLERARGAPGRHASATLGRALVLPGVFLAWVPFRAADLDAVVACYGAIGHGGWAPPSLGFLFGAAVVLLADVFRVPLAATDAPARAAGWRGRAWIGRGVLWPACGVVVALLTHLFWGAAEKAFIYFRF